MQEVSDADFNESAGFVRPPSDFIWPLDPPRVLPFQPDRSRPSGERLVPSRRCNARRQGGAAAGARQFMMIDFMCVCHSGFQNEVIGG